MASVRRRTAAFLPAIVIVASLFSGPAPTRAEPASDVRVLSQNMYVGSDFTALNAATTIPEFLAAVTTIYDNILAAKPEERVAAMAREIAKARPDFVALHEAMILRSGFPLPTTVQMDLLQSMLDELEALGQHYVLVTTVNGVDATAPSSLGFNVRLTDRDAILMRTDAGITTTGTASQHFPTPRTTSTPIGTLVTPGGYVSIDAIVRGLAMRFVSVHLDPACSATQCDPIGLAIQLQQTNELLQLAGNTTLPLVLVGDFNTAADEPSHPSHVIYEALINAGLTDAWKRNSAGFTCCQDEDLLNPKSKLSVRIDLVLFRGDFDAKEVNLIGDKHSDKTPSGLWPSDHAGITATLGGPRRP
jgi:endonuclease/exonuclease/phosphatase family metal-dependent hydrolase